MQHFASNILPQNQVQGIRPIHMLHSESDDALDGHHPKIYPKPNHCDLNVSGAIFSFKL